MIGIQISDYLFNRDLLAFLGPTQAEVNVTGRIFCRQTPPSNKLGDYFIRFWTLSGHCFIRSADGLPLSLYSPLFEWALQFTEPPMFSVVAGSSSLSISGLGTLKKRTAPLPPQYNSYGTLPGNHHARSPSDPHGYHTMNVHKRSPSNDSTKAIHLGEYFERLLFRTGKVTNWLFMAFLA